MLTFTTLPSEQPKSTYSFIRAMGATLEALIAAFCRLDKSLSCCWEKGWLVGAVGIEPHDPLGTFVAPCFEVYSSTELSTVLSMKNQASEVTR
jgi:hypothetical protein